MDRVERFAAALSEAGMAAALVMNPPDVFYLSGTGQPANLLVRPGDEPILFSRRYHDLARATSRVPVLEGAGFGAIVEHVPEGRLGMELDRVPGGLVDSARRRFGEIVDCAPLLLAQRAVKDAEEIEAMRASVALFDAVHATLLEHIRPGITELELAAEVERALRRAGHDGVVFQRRWDAKLPMEGSIASGEHLSTISRGPITVTGVGLPGSSFPMGASRRELRPGDLVLIDLGLNRGGYHGDMARTYAVEELPDGVEELARKCRELQDVALEAIRPGVPAHRVYDVTHQAAQRLGLEDVFQGGGPYIGHAIGLELDEPPVLGPGVETPIEEGMVLAVEPKLISPAFGAVNIEDDVVVTADGCEILGDVPRCLFVVGEGGEVARVP